MSSASARIIVFVCLLVGWGSAAALTNQLKDHPSPYLALHGDDPVAWQDWAPAAAGLAREHGKLLYISVGYFACHWCHVMQRESYKDEDIARILNQDFIPVKVDRELEPALDARLIEFARATQGAAGWPLNVFLTPQGHPLYAVLYLPPQNFKQVLTRLQGLWQTDQQSLAQLAARETASAHGPGEPKLDPDTVRDLARSVVSDALNMADTLQGGFGQSNKFPMAPQIEFLLEQYEQTGNPELREFLMLTLDQMAENGMYDHVGDGFFRYATDPNWDTPHFEKMLYDNAQLSVLFLRAASVFEAPRYDRVARRTLDFMLREMASSNGAMVASFSAVDTEDVEGGYYLWQQSDLSMLLTAEEKEVARLAWSLQGPVLFAAGYLPRQGMSVSEISVELKISDEDAASRLESARSKLYRARSNRGLPIDTKLLAGWNGLALAALAGAADSLADDSYRDGAHKIRDYIMSRLWDGSTLHRAVDGQRALGRASLEDYAYVAKGLWAWAEITQAPADYSAAASVVEQAWVRFYDAGWRMAESSLIAAETGRDRIADGPMPSPAAVVSHISIKLAKATGNVALRERALAALNSTGAQIDRGGFWHVSQVRAMLEAVNQ